MNNAESTLLIDQIFEATRELYRLKQCVEVQEKHVESLRAQRATCKHVFSEPLKGYEHEGGMCVLCGINELHAFQLKTA